MALSLHPIEVSARAGLDDAFTAMNKAGAKALIVLTDRNDLDDQLFGQFQRCHEIVRQTPVQAESVEHLRVVRRLTRSILPAVGRTDPFNKSVSFAVAIQF